MKPRPIFGQVGVCFLWRRLLAPIPTTTRVVRPTAVAAPVALSASTLNPSPSVRPLLRVRTVVPATVTVVATTRNTLRHGVSVAVLVDLVHGLDATVVRRPYGRVHATTAARNQAKGESEQNQKHDVLEHGEPPMSDQFHNARQKRILRQ